jgi:hypothetical protein
MEDAFGCLCLIFWLPHKIGKAMNEASLVGASEMDRQAAKFWKRCGIAAVILMIILLGIVSWFIFKR